jgi:hypothetical protein
MLRACQLATASPTRRSGSSTCSASVCPAHAYVPCRSMADDGCRTKLTSHHLCGWTSACCTPPCWMTRWRSSGVCMLTCAKPSRPRSLPRRTACGRPPRRRRRGWVRSTWAPARSSHTRLYLTAAEGACAAAAAYVRRELSVYAAAHPELTPDDATTALKKQWHDMLPDAQEVRAALPRRHAYAHYRVHIRPHTMGIVLLVGGDDGGDWFRRTWRPLRRRRRWAPVNQMGQRPRTPGQARRRRRRSQRREQPPPAAVSTFRGRARRTS